jgi:hypothetical protein
METVHVMNNQGLACVGDALARPAVTAQGVSLHKHGDHRLPDGVLMIYRAEPGWFGICRVGVGGRIKRFRDFARALSTAQRIAA